MDAVQLGPLVISAPRLQAALGFAVLVLASTVLARRVGPRLADWAWAVVVVVLMGARLGFVASHWRVYAQDPLSVLFIWQGGFAPFWGIAAGALYSLWALRNEPCTRRAAVYPAALALAVWGLLAWGGGGPPQAPALAELAAPLRTLEGHTQTLADVAGQGVVVNLWATWCPPCRREMPLLFAEASANPGVVMLLVNQGESAEAVGRYLEGELGLTGETAARVLLDARGRLAAELRAPGLPTTLFFDAEGRLVHRHVGEISRAELRKRVQALVAEPSHRVLMNNSAVLARR